MFWTTIDSSWLHKADTAAYARELDAVRAIEPSMVLSSHLPAASGAMLDVLLDALGDVPGAPLWLLVAGLALLLVVLTTTAFVSAALHGRLTARKDPVAIDRLVTTNWIRTAGWTGRGAVALAMVVLAT